jgi:polyisoprenoid-binding protein YceI
VNLRAAAAACALAASAAAVAQPATYVLDPERSFVHFEVLHFNTSTIRGRFGPVVGAVTLDPAAGRGELSLSINTAAVDTGLKIFDARLRRDDLLASDAYPEAFFVAQQFRFDGATLGGLRGEFTWRGVSQPLSLRALRFACRDTVSAGQAAGQVCGGDFEGELRRSDFGATFGLPFVADTVRLVVQVQGTRR